MRALRGRTAVRRRAGAGGRRAAGWTAAALAVLAPLAVAGCAGRGLELPTGASGPFPRYAETFAAVTDECRYVRSLTAELRLSGRSGSTRLRGRVLAGIASPDGLRLEGVAPFGAPAFILAAQGGVGSLVLPRDDRVLTGQPPELILEALVGLPLAPAELLAIATGCVTADPSPQSGRTYGDQWMVVDLGADATAYLQGTPEAPRLVAATVPGFLVEYVRFAYGFPAELQIRSRPADAAGATRLTVEISQFETNRTLGDEVFRVVIPSTAVPLTLAELRAAGPLGAP